MPTTSCRMTGTRQVSPTKPLGCCDGYSIKNGFGKNSLRANFNSSLEWKPKALQNYGRQVNRFLEHLLLLVHLTSGQPARVTEIISVRHVNTMHHRNIFIKDGLVGIVTSYHKGSTCTGSTKIIHRYLPKEVGELLVYYLLLIFPFVKQITLLPSNATAQIPDSFLWSQGGESWNSQRLSEILERES